jgi:hypothetical protein
MPVIQIGDHSALVSQMDSASRSKAGLQQQRDRLAGAPLCSLCYAECISCT